MVNDLSGMLRTIILTCVCSVVDVFVESFEIIDSKDDTTRGPRPDSMCWILFFEPCNQCTGIASTYDYPVSFAAKNFILLINEVSNVCESLVGVKIPEVFSWPIFHWLRVSVISMLQRHQQGVIVSTNHHGEHLFVRWRARPLTTDIEEDRTILLVEELIVFPVPLFVGGQALRTI